MRQTTSHGCEKRRLKEMKYSYVQSLFSHHLSEWKVSYLLKNAVINKISIKGGVFDLIGHRLQGRKHSKQDISTYYVSRWMKSSIRDERVHLLFHKSSTITFLDAILFFTGSLHTRTWYGTRSPYLGPNPYCKRPAPGFLPNQSTNTWTLLCSLNYGFLNYNIFYYF